MWAVDRDIAQFHNAQVQNQYGARLQVLAGTSWDMAAQVSNQSLDFFFIDAGHGYKSVRRDLEAWIPKLKSTGWFIGHDINFPAVNRAVVDQFGHYEVGPDNVWFLSPNNDYSMLKKL
jgi:predicted O-methyltransferase YrrM